MLALSRSRPRLSSLLSGGRTTAPGSDARALRPPGSERWARIAGPLLSINGLGEGDPYPRYGLTEPAGARRRFPSSAPPADCPHPLPLPAMRGTSTADLQEGWRALPPRRHRRKTALPAQASFHGSQEPLIAGSLRRARPVFSDPDSLPFALGPRVQNTCAMWPGLARTRDAAFAAVAFLPRLPLDVNWRRIGALYNRGQEPDARNPRFGDLHSERRRPRRTEASMAKPWMLAATLTQRDFTMQQGVCPRGILLGSMEPRCGGHRSSGHPVSGDILAAFQAGDRLPRNTGFSLRRPSPISAHELFGCGICMAPPLPPRRAMVSLRRASYLSMGACAPGAGFPVS